MRYLLLGTSALFTGLLAIRGTWDESLTGYLSNVSAGLLTTLLVLLLVERGQEKRRQQELARFRKLASNELQPALARLVQLLADAVKAAGPSDLARLPTAREELLQADVLDDLDWLDLSKSAGTVDGQSWDRIIEERVREVRDTLNQVVTKYSVHIPPEAAERVQDLRSDAFLMFCANIATVREKVPREVDVSLNGTKPLRDTFLPKLDALLSALDIEASRRVALSSNYLRADVAPLASSARRAALGSVLGITKGALPRHAVEP